MLRERERERETERERERGGNEQDALQTQELKRVDKNHVINGFRKLLPDSPLVVFVNTSLFNITMCPIISTGKVSSGAHTKTYIFLVAPKITGLRSYKSCKYY